MSAPVFLPLMRDPLPDAGERVHQDVLSLPFGMPRLVFRETAIRRMTYESAPAVFRCDGEEQKCP
jgi:hypothetical protein